MKKKLPVLLLSALFLVGCNEQPAPETPAPEKEPETVLPGPVSNDDNGSDNNNVTNDDNGGGTNTNDNGDNTNTNNGDNVDVNNNENNNNNNDDNKKESQEYVATFVTCGDGFSNEIPMRTAFAGSTNANNVDKLKTYLSRGLEYDDLITNLEFGGYVQALDAYQGVVHLCLGSSSTDGLMTWTSTRKILKVETTVVNYYKTYTAWVEGQAVPDSITSDCLAHFMIDDTDYSLELTESLVPEVKTFTQTYGEEGTSSFSFASVSGRVLIKSIRITWKI